MRIGMGYDVHRLEEGRKLILGEWKYPLIRACLGIRMQMWRFTPSWTPFGGGCTEGYRYAFSRQ